MLHMDASHARHAFIRDNTVKPAACLPLNPAVGLLHGGAYAVGCLQTASIARIAHSNRG